MNVNKVSYKILTITDFDSKSMTSLLKNTTNKGRRVDPPCPTGLAGSKGYLVPPK